MKIEYNPGDTAAGEAAYSALLPEGYDRTKHYRWRFMIHGIAERSQGRIEDLMNITEGFDYNNDGIRDSGVLTEDMKAAVDKYGIVLIVATYAGFMEPAKINAVYDHATAKYSLTSKFDLSGFSLGGGAEVKYITSSEENARKVNTAVIAAPTNPGPGSTDPRWLIPQKVGLPLHIFVNDEDENGPTNLSVTKTIMGLLKTGNFTAFHKRGHGGFNEAHTIAPPIAPGGQGVINIAENVYQWAEDVFNNGARPIKTGTVVTPPVVEPPTTTAKAVASYTGTGPSIRLIGDKSIGWKTGYEASWSFVTGPAGVTSKQVFPGGSSFINATANLPVQGTYVFQLNLTGAEPVKLTVVYGSVVQPPVSKEVLSFDSSTDMITFKDNTTESGRSVYQGGKWKIISASGATYEL